MTTAETKPRSIKRPRFQPGAKSCSMCQDVVTFDRLRYRDQVNPERAVICDPCGERLAERGVLGHG